MTHKYCPLHQDELFEPNIVVCPKCGNELELAEFTITPLQIANLMEDEKFLNRHELRLLYNFLKNQYIDYENLELLKLVHKISDIANK